LRELWLLLSLECVQPHVDVATLQLVFRHLANVNELEVGCSARQVCGKACSSPVVARLDSTSLEKLVEELLQPSSIFLCHQPQLQGCVCKRCAAASSIAVEL
jgi:hypothetical protein